jgi:hypothetical protein
MKTGWIRNFVVMFGFANAGMKREHFGMSIREIVMTTLDMGLHI